MQHQPNSEEQAPFVKPPKSVHNHDSAALCGTSCPGYLGVQWEKAAALVRGRRGWVPGIPLPLFVRFGRARCDCGDTFRNRRRYREHFALVHVLGLS